MRSVVWTVRRQASDWKGVDENTFAFVRRMAHERRLDSAEVTAARDWFRGLLDAGLPTDLDADFAAQPMSDHLETALREAGYASAVRRRLRDIEGLRDALQVYVQAHRDGLRSRPVPPIAVKQRRAFAVSHDVVRGALPREDQRRLAEGDQILDLLARLQWEQRSGDATRCADGKMRHPTVAPSTAFNEQRAMRAFLQHAHRKDWQPFDFEHLLTAERVCDFLFYGQNYDGSARAVGCNEKLAYLLRDYLYRTRTHSKPVAFVTEERLAEIDARIKLEMTRTHLHNVRPASESNKGRYKWFPTLEQVELAIAGLEEMIRQADAKRAAGTLTFLQYWTVVRNATLGLVTLFTMARVDSVSTISLSHIRRDPETGAILRFGGSAIVADIVRAKTKNKQWFPFVPEFTLTANLLPYIEKLLAIEGRSLDEPLRAGELPVRLRVGDKWGGTRIPSGELLVVPLFRADPNRPQPLCRERIRRVLQDLLMDLHFGATNPHTFRATGAIYWTFVRGMPEEFVMQLGLWTSPSELRESYAKIRNTDRLRLIGKYVPVEPGTVPSAVTSERGQTASEAIAALTRLLERPNDAVVAHAEVATVRRCAERIEQSIAAQSGVAWAAVTPSPFRPGEIETMHERFVVLGVLGGLDEVLGRDFSAEQRLRSRAKGAAAREPRVPTRINYLRTTLATRQAVEPRKLNKAR
ncbi:MAG TPA: hypothetical protein VFC31_08555 [Candidatus Limnocylindria bacterium]|nr:hypothetical protein [Candidatus Limnocylindria bacterium]